MVKGESLKVKGIRPAWTAYTGFLAQNNPFRGPLVIPLYHNQRLSQGRKEEALELLRMILNLGYEVTVSPGINGAYTVNIRGQCSKEYSGDHLESTYWKH